MSLASDIVGSFGVGVWGLKMFGYSELLEGLRLGTRLSSLLYFEFHFSYSRVWKAVVLLQRVMRGRVDLSSLSVSSLSGAWIARER
jgi:hypothetical protein